MTGIILAGGKSSRMNNLYEKKGSIYSKAFLKINGKTIIDSIIDKFKNIFNEIFVIVSPENAEIFRKKIKKSRVQIFNDMIPGKNSLGGIYTGLKRSRDVYNFIVACDMPFLNTGLINYMIKKHEGYDAVAPFIKNKYEPLHTVYSRNCLITIRKQIENGNLRITDIFDKIKTKRISSKEIKKFDHELNSFFNINTFKDYKTAQMSAYV